MGKTSAAPEGTGQHRAKEGSAALPGSKRGVPLLQPPAPSLACLPCNTLSWGRSYGRYGLMLLGAI